MLFLFLARQRDRAGVQGIGELDVFGSRSVAIFAAIAVHQFVIEREIAGFVRMVLLRVPAGHVAAETLRIVMPRNVAAVVRTVKRLWPNCSIDSSLHVLALGLLLGLSLPVVCDSFIPGFAGVVMGAICFGVGRSRKVRVHPVAATMVIFWLLGMLAPWK